MHLPAHFCSLTNIAENTLQYDDGKSILDYDAFQPVNAGGLLTVLWRTAPGASVEVKADTEYECNLVPLTIPTGFRRIAHLGNWPDVEAERYPADRLTSMRGNEEAGTLYLLNNLREYTDTRPGNDCVQNTIGSFHPCKSQSDDVGVAPYDILQEGVNGRPCANPMQSKGSTKTPRSPTRTSIAVSPYVVVEWNWKEYYPFPDELSSATIRHIHMLSLFELQNPVCMVGMVIPGGTVVWVPILSKKMAKRADTELRKNSVPTFVLKRPKFIDGPDIFVAGCNFKPR